LKTMTKDVGFNRGTYSKTGKASRLLFFMGLGLVSSLQSFFDNRYMPALLLEKSPIRWCRPGNISVAPFFVIADRSYGPYDDSRSLYGFRGTYNLYYVDEALRNAGKISQSFLRPDIANSATSIPFCQDGLLQVLGLAFDARYDVVDTLQWGCKGSLMHAQARTLFYFDNDHGNYHPHGDGDLFELQQTQDEMHTFMGIKAPVWNEYMAGDLDVFARLHVGHMYWYKINHIDAGISLGMVIPGALDYDLNQPVSMSLGGETLGFYGKVDVRALLREDIQCSLWGRVQKRLSKIVNRRMMIYREHIDYGGETGLLEIHPGFTGGFGLELIMEHVRGGLGFYLSYGAVFHGHDILTDKRVNKTVAVNLGELCEISQWNTDYATIGCMYDAAGDCASMDTGKPVFLFSWDIPLGFLAGKNALKSNGIMIRGEIQF